MDATSNPAIAHHRAGSATITPVSLGDPIIDATRLIVTGRAGAGALESLIRAFCCAGGEQARRSVHRTPVHASSPLALR